MPHDVGEEFHREIAIMKSLSHPNSMYYLLSIFFLINFM